MLEQEATKTQSAQIDQLRVRLQELEEANRRLRESEASLRARLEAEQSELWQKFQQASGILDALFDNAPLGMGLWDRQLRFVRVNQALAEINGLPPEAHLGKTVAELLPGVEPSVMQAFQRVVDEGESLLDMEATGETPAQPGKQRYWMVSYYPVRYDGQIVGVGAVCEEITQKKQIEAEQAQLLADQEELNQLKDQFLSVASHDLRTPLTSVRGYAQLIQRSLIQLLHRQTDGPERSTIERNLQAVEVILNQSNRMGDLINRLLEFSRIQTGQVQLNIETGSDLAALIASVVERQNITSDHLISLEVGPGAYRADYDPAQIEQVLDNLIGNAVKYSPAGSRVRVGLIHSEPTNQLIVSVRDEGIGISPENSQHLFKRFYRVQNDQTRYISGMGLGLFISYEIITRHGGQIWLESQPGLGSTFYFSLPQFD